MQTPIANTPSTLAETFHSPNNSDDIEIDIRKYVTIITSRWRLVLTSVLIAAMLGGLLSFLVPSPYEATSTVAIVKTSTQVEFDPRIKTVTQDEIAAANADARRATFVGLVENATIAGNVVNSIEDQLTSEERNPARMLDKIDATTSGRGDLILIKVRDRNPDKAATIATAWAQEYERYVNSLYSGAPAEYSTSVSAEYTRAVEDFNKAQTAFETYIANSRIDLLQRSISETRQLLDALQVGKQNALTLVISEQLKVNSEIISAYLGAQSANRLVAFEKEQEGRRELIRAYLDARNDGQVNVFSEQIRADLNLLRNLHDTQTRTRQLIGSASAMRDQVQRGGDEAAQSNNIALSLLKTQAFALTVPISDNIQLALPSQANLTTAAGQVSDLDGLIVSLRDRDAAISKEIATVSERLITGKGYTFATTDDGTSPIAKVISSTYPLLFDVGTIGKLSESVPVSNPLTLAAQARAAEVLRFSATDLSASALSENGTADESIVRLQKKLASAQAELEKERSTFAQLQTERDLKRDTADTLARKQAEVTLSSAIAGSEVRLASAALPPERPVIGRTTFVAIAALAGLVLGIGLCFVAYMIIGNNATKIHGDSPLSRTARAILLPR
jgi:uncharacterized protein involved in exopolysaccharide biosynthesis